MSNHAMRSSWCAVAILLASCCVSWAANIGNAAYGIYCEAYEGMKYNVNNPADPDGGYMGAWNCALSADTSAAEGTNALKLETWGQNGGTYIQFGYDGATNPQIATDMSAYSGGSISFMVRTSYESGIKIEWLDSFNNKVGFEIYMNANLGVALDNNWHYVSIPLSSFTGIDLSKVVTPAVLFTQWVADPPLTRTFWVDNIVWNKSAPGSLDIQLKNVSDNQTTDQITWGNVIVGSTAWKAADQYLELKHTYFTPGWGIQIYTDNTSAGANPQYTGTGDPVGLIYTSSTTKRLPMCWRVVDVSTTTLTIRQGASGYPDRLWSQQLGDQYPCFLWMKDRGTQGFVDAEDYITVWDNRGIQHGETSWGGAVSPNYIYLGANFTDAIGPATFKTDTLTVELFYE